MLRLHSWVGRCAIGLVALIGLASATEGGTPLRFFAIGDLPYRESEWPIVERMLGDAARQDPPFIVHVGDIKAGSSPCSAASFERVAALFRRQPVPVLYTPGDNEWTDCHRAQAGRHDPQERLDLLRRVFFADPDVLRLSTLRATQPVSAYPENYWLRYGDVLIAAIHVVGSHNNSRSGDRAAAAERQARAEANRALLADALARAGAAQAKALILLFHANPSFERPGFAPGYQELFVDLQALRRRFGGPILVIHGDTHQYRLDYPLAHLERRAPDLALARLEVPGSPFVGGAWVSVDPAGTPAFAAEVDFPVALDSLPRD